jgi:SAM-dependent methyltransferase
MPPPTTVRDLYESFPFPARRPAAEKPGSLPLTRTDILGKVDHHAFGGRAHFTKGFRALVAGGGTGDSAIFLAAQLRDTDAEIVCLDLSEASLEIARSRAARRGLEARIRWVQASLLDLPRLELGRFDYVTCLGVLHHLPDPDAGLHALTQVLNEHGAMGLMVYGRYGRLDIYAMQELMKLVNRDEPDLRGQLANLRTCLRSLSPSHLMVRGRSFEALESMAGDDANLVDTFLHVQDRAYTVPELHEFVERAGLSITGFTNFHRTLRIEYEPEVYVIDEGLRTGLSGRPPRERHAIGELLHGHMYVHGFYAARPGRAAASFLDPDMVPYFLTAPAAEAVAQLVAQGAAEVHLSSRRRFRFAPAAAALACLAAVDSRRTLGEIWSKAGKALGVSAEEIARAAAADLERSNALNWVFLRHRECPPPPMLAYAFRGDAAELVRADLAGAAAGSRA